MKLIIYIDGACRFNPGPAGIGVWVADDQGRVLKEISEYIGESTNNVAEWSAYRRALQYALKIAASELTIFTDSQLLYEQVRGNYKIRQPKLQSIADQANELKQSFKEVRLIKVPREQNKLADRLAKKAVAGKLKHSVPRILYPDYKSE